MVSLPLLPKKMFQPIKFVHAQGVTGVDLTSSFSVGIYVIWCRQWGLIRGVSWVGVLGSLIPVYIAKKIFFAVSIAVSSNMVSAYSCVLPFLVSLMALFPMRLHLWLFVYFILFLIFVLWMATNKVLSRQAAKPIHARPVPLWEVRKKFGLLEKHKDYVVRARAYHIKEATIAKLEEKAAFRYPDEFYFKMVNSRTVGGIHRPKPQDNKYTEEELLLLKNKDMGYVLQSIQSEKKKIEKLSSTLHELDSKPQNKHVYFAEDREEAKEIQSRIGQISNVPGFDNNTLMG